MQILTDRDSIRRVSTSAPFLKALPKEQWPDRTYDRATAPPEGPYPASGRAELLAGELAELEDRLQAFALFLYGGALYRALLSLSATGSQSRAHMTFAVSASSGATDYVFEYDPASGRFSRRQSPPPLADYAAALQCFASDLLEFLQGKLAPSALMFGRVCRWRGSTENTSAAIDQAIWLYGHPLRRQAEYAQLYSDIFAAEPTTVPRIPARANRK
jgi:hypothetical protein